MAQSKDVEVEKYELSLGVLSKVVSLGAKTVSTPCEPEGTNHPRIKVTSINQNNGHLYAFADTEVSLDINEQGELIIIGENAERYSMDENGNLIYTYCE